MSTLSGIEDYVENLNYCNIFNVKHISCILYTLMPECTGYFNQKLAYYIVLFLTLRNLKWKLIKDVVAVAIIAELGLTFTIFIPLFCFFKFNILGYVHFKS